MKLCYFLAFDFDNHDDKNEPNLKEEIEALRKTCKNCQISHLVERSRSGKGYHIWFFFQDSIPAYLAREFGTALLLKSSEQSNLTDFKTFDRMIPASDHLPINRKTRQKDIGNMIALPLQGQALKRGKSAFINES